MLIAGFVIFMFLAFWNWNLMLHYTTYSYNRWVWFIFLCCSLFFGSMAIWFLMQIALIVRLP